VSKFPPGTAAGIHVVQRLGSGLDRKVMEAVERRRFKPGMKDGKPVTVEAIIEVNFRLP
jgi:outer membrane biosynthesis protein TonB